MTQDQSNVSQVTQQAEQLRQVYSDLDAGISQLQQLHAQIKRQWYGPASETYCKALEQLILRMQDTNSTLMKASAALELALSENTQC